MLLHKQQVTISKITPDITVTKFRNVSIPDGQMPIKKTSELAWKIILTFKSMQSVQLKSVVKYTKICIDN
jgi:hypothetical protein